MNTFYSVTNHLPGLYQKHFVFQSIRAKKISTLKACTPIELLPGHIHAVIPPAKSGSISHWEARAGRKRISPVFPLILIHFLYLKALCISKLIHKYQFSKPWPDKLYTVIILFYWLNVLLQLRTQAAALVIIVLAAYRGRH